MDEAVKMGKVSATGSFQLLIGKIASTLMLAIGSIIVGMFIVQEEYGLYTIALIPMATFMLFQDWGVSTALTKRCANYRAAKMEEELRNTIVSGLTFHATTASALTMLSLLAANFVASTIFGNPESVFLVILASMTILPTAILGSCVAVFVGFERMELSTVTMIVSAAMQGSLSPLLVYLGFGAVGALVGLTAASIASAVAAVTLLYFSILRKLPPVSINKAKMAQTLKHLLSYGIPISITAIIGGVSTQVNLFLMASFTDTAMIGNYRIASNFAILLTFFVDPITTVLFPAFSKINPVRNKQLLKTVFASSVKYSSIFLAPAVVALMVLSAPIIGTIYGDKWPSAPFFLTLSIIAYLFVLLGNLSYNRLLYATGETKMLMKLSAVALCIDVPLAFLLIPPLGILGVIIVGSLVAEVPSMFIVIYWAWKRYETKADLRNSARIFLASAIAGLTTYLFLRIFVVATWIMLAVGAILFLVVYLISTPLVGAINQMDISNLRIMFSGLGPISKLLGTLLALIQRLLGIKEKLKGA